METGTIALIISVVALLIVVTAIIVNLKKKEKAVSSSQELPGSDSADVVEIVEVKKPDLSAALSDAVFIEIIPDKLDDMQGEQGLIFERAEESDEKQYKEIVLDKTSRIGGTGAKVGSAIGQQLFSIHQLAAQAPNGLFTATTNPALLTRLSDGTVSTMVHGSKGIVAHYGFEELKGISMFNPGMLVNIGMQGMAFVSGQYYLKQINDRMDKLESKVDELKEILESEKIGSLINDLVILKKIAARENVDGKDLDQVIDIITDTGKIYEDYKNRVETRIKKLKNFSGSKSTAEDNLEEYRQKLFDLQDLMEICFFSDQLRLKAEMAEIAVRRRINPKDPKIDELVSELKVDIENSYSFNTCKGFKELEDSVLERAEIIGSNHRGLKLWLKSHFGDPEEISTKLLEPINTRMNNMKKELNSLVESDLLKRVLTEGEANRRVLLIPGSEGQEQRMFIEVS